MILFKMNPILFLTLLNWMQFNLTAFRVDNALTGLSKIMVDIALHLY